MRTLNDNIKEIRRVLNGLLPPDVQHLGLVSALRKQLERLDKEMGKLHVEFTGKRATGHLGIWGMKQRGQAIGGVVEFNSIPGIGTTIQISITTESLAKAMMN